MLPLIIIWGSSGVTKTIKKGDFHCPECAETRGYEFKNVHRFFTLYFIPLFPLEKLSEYIECNRCKNAFKPVVLEYDPEKERMKAEANFHFVIRRVMVLMMLADGQVDEREKATIIEVYKGITGETLTDTTVDQEIEAAKSEGLSIEDYLAQVSAQLNNHGKEMVIRAAYFVAAADGRIEDEEEQLIFTIANALQLTAAHFKGIIADLQNPST